MTLAFYGRRQITLQNVISRVIAKFDRIFNPDCMTIAVKNMVCPRCIAAVQHILTNMGLNPRYVRLGEVDLEGNPSGEQMKKLENELRKAGFELLDDEKKTVIEKVKSLLIEKVQEGDVPDHFSISRFLKDRVFRNYSSLSKLFTEVEGITIEQFFILQKIEKVKEWLIYKELSLSQIAANLGYSSVQHLSGQFKKLTGMTPTQFRELGASNRKSIDSLHI